VIDIDKSHGWEIESSCHCGFQLDEKMDCAIAEVYKLAEGAVTSHPADNRCKGIGFRVIDLFRVRYSRLCLDIKR
jgi:hypothetical protein